MTIILKHDLNGYVATRMIKSTLPKVQSNDQAAKQFEEGFNLSRNAMRITGLIELVGSIFLFMSIFGKRFVRIGSILINIVLLGAIFKHFQAGHGVKGAKGALNLFEIGRASCRRR